MARFRFLSGNFWAARAVFDEVQNKSQDELNRTTAQLAALAVAGNTGKLLGIGTGGALEAVQLSSWTGGSY
jgi:hypothetical protein